MYLCWTKRKLVFPFMYQGNVFQISYYWCSRPFVNKWDSPLKSKVLYRVAINITVPLFCSKKICKIILRTLITLMGSFINILKSFFITRLFQSSNKTFHSIMRFQFGISLLSISLTALVQSFDKVLTGSMHLFFINSCIYVVHPGHCTTINTVKT